MAEILTKSIVNCSTGEVSVVPLSETELSARASETLMAEQNLLAEKARQEEVASLKASAKAKLIAGQPLTEEEAEVLVF